MKTLSTLCLQGMLECHYLSMECGSFWGLLFVPLDLLQDSIVETWGSPKHLERVVEPASSSITFVCPPENPRRPSQQQGWWQHTPSALLCAPKEGSLGSHCFPPGEVSSVQRNPHRALGLISMNKVENLAYQNELYTAKCSLVLHPHSHSSSPQTSLSPHFRPSFDTSPVLPQQQHWGPLKVRDLYFLQSLTNNRSSV